MGILALAAACSDQGPGTPRGDLEAAEARWRAFKPAKYTFAVMRQCFCAPEGRGPVRMTVSGGVAVSKVYVEDGTSVTGDAVNWFPDVDGLFSVLRDAIDTGAHEVRVTYDPVTGVPVDFWIDYQVNVADEELGFVVTESVVATN